MKTISEILENYSEYKTFLDDRFGKRLCNFSTPEQAEKIEYKFKKEYEPKHIPKEWTEENILSQLKEDILFGWEKCQCQRGISAELMSNVVLAWCKILENGLENTEYGYYGDNVFQTVAERYRIKLPT